MSTKAMPRSAASRAGLASDDRVVRTDAGGLLGRVAKRRAARGHGVVRRRDDEHAASADFPHERIEDVADVPPVGGFGHPLHHVVHPDEQAHELRSQCW